MITIGITVEIRPFLEKTSQPQPLSIQAALGDAYLIFQELEASTAGYIHTWNHSKQSGWMLKVHDKKKALLYVIPLQNAFRVSLAVRENERETLLNEPQVAAIHAELGSAKKYSEGYAMAFFITDKVSFAPLKALVERLIALR